MNEHRITLSDEVEDIVTGFKGIATGRCEYLNGCKQYSVSNIVLDQEYKKERVIVLKLFGLTNSN